MANYLCFLLRRTELSCWPREVPVAAGRSLRQRALVQLPRPREPLLW